MLSLGRSISIKKAFLANSSSLMVEEEVRRMKMCCTGAVVHPCAQLFAFRLSPLASQSINFKSFLPYGLFGY